MQDNKPLFDFTAAGRQGWEASHDLAPLDASAEGLILRATGGDPYAVGPTTTVPAGKPLWLKIRLKASQTGMAQIFYFPEGGGPGEKDSVRFPVAAGEWREISLPLPALQTPRYRFRIDPPGNAEATTTIALLDMSPRIETPEPEWPRPTNPDLPANAPAVRAGALTVRHGATFGALELLIGGERFALGNNRPLLGYQVALDQTAKWIQLASATPAVYVQNGNIVVTGTLTDPDGAEWTLTQKFSPGKRPDSLLFESSVSVSAARTVLYFPFLTLLPGVGTFGEKKNQGLLAGVEYLDKDEPSSSEADIRGLEAQRQVPDRHKLTLPLMAIAASGRWAGVAWTPSENVAACFDSPDRRFKSGGHLLSLLFPGAEGMTRRAPGSLPPLRGAELKAKQAVITEGMIYGGLGGDVTLAVRAYVADKGLPSLPTKGAIAEVAPIFAAGWLDSAIKVGSRYRHAFPGDFGPQPAADAALCQDWLASPSNVLPPSALTTGDTGRLRAAARAAREGIASPDLRNVGVGHVRTPAALLAYADEAGVWEGIKRSVDEGRELLQRLDEGNGRIPYRPAPGKTDYGKTHYADHANGLTAEVVARALDLARFTGDGRLVRDSLIRLKDLENYYRGTVPRGAQTWEVPLHTPDILASAHLVRAFVRGYELTDEPRYLDAARYWAWTGIPFVYLVPPTSHPVGLYGTTPVLGATNWEAPNWIGLPVQWCGLVFADALYDLAFWDAGGVWKRIADGIVVSGLQQTWPRNDKLGSDKQRQGLLPDSFDLPGQIRNDVAINPATLQVPYARFVGKPMYSAFRLAPNGLYAHAPGAVTPVSGLGSGLRFKVDGWLPGDYFILITGFASGNVTEVRLNSRPVKFTQRPREGRILLTARGKCTLEVVY